MELPAANVLALLDLHQSIEEQMERPNVNGSSRLIKADMGYNQMLHDQFLKRLGVGEKLAAIKIENLIHMKGKLCTNMMISRNSFL